MFISNKSISKKITVDYQYFPYSHNYNQITENEYNVAVQLLLQNQECNLEIPDNYKIDAAAYAVEGLKDNNLTADIDLYAAIERGDWKEVTRIYQEVFRPNLKKFAEETILKALNKQAA